MIKTWDRSAMRFASAQCVDRQRMLDVTFEDGDHFLVAVDSVLSPFKVDPVGFAETGAAVLAAPDWLKMRIGETGDVLEVPSGNADIEIPWDRIRSIADAEFRSHLADRAQARARSIGKRVRAMRLEAGLTGAALAERVGATHDVIANMEAGKSDTKTVSIEAIANALGRHLRDFEEA